MFTFEKCHQRSPHPPRVKIASLRFFSCRYQSCFTLHSLKGGDDRISRVIFLAEWNESSRRPFIPCRTLALQLICVEQRTYIAIRNNLKPILTMILYTIQTKYSHLISIEIVCSKELVFSRGINSGLKIRPPPRHGSQRQSRE